MDGHDGSGREEVLDVEEVLSVVEVQVVSSVTDQLYGLIAGHIFIKYTLVLARRP